MLALSEHAFSFVYVWSSVTESSATSLTRALELEGMNRKRKITEQKYYKFSIFYYLGIIIR